MNEILKKIDEFKNHQMATVNGKIFIEAEAVKDIILSQEKEPPTIPKLAQGTQPVLHGMYCSGHKDKEYIQPTIGDKIRESNESLTKFLDALIDKCASLRHESCNNCPLHENGCGTPTMIMTYLNQPYKEEPTQSPNNTP